MPKNKLRLIIAWCEIHKDELLQNWELAIKKWIYRILLHLYKEVFYEMGCNECRANKGLQIIAYF